MKEKLIKNYINKLQLNDIKEFTINNNIYLNNDEIIIIYDVLKNNYKDLLNGNYNNSFRILKKNLIEKNYEQIKKLFFKYKEKYQHLL